MEKRFVTLENQSSLLRFISFLTCFDLIVVTTPIKYHFPFTTHVAIAGIAVMCLIQKNLPIILKNRAVLLAFSVAFCFAICYAIGHGPSISEYLYRYVRLIPLFIAGVLLARNLNWSSRVFLFSLVGMAIGNIAVAFTPSSDLVVRSTIENDALLASWSRYLVPVLTLAMAPHCWAFFRGRIARSTIIIASAIGVVSVLRCGFTAIFVLFILLGINYWLISVFMKRAMLKRKIIYSVVIAAVFLSTFYIMDRFASSSNVWKRSTNLIGLMKGQSIDLNVTTGLRNKLGGVSKNAFFSNPLFGVGSYAFIFGKFPIGGHSTILDILAQFGLFGAVPIFGMVISWAMASLWLLRKGISSTLGHGLAALWLTYIGACFINPYFLSGAVDHYVFTFAGITIGQRYFVQWKSTKKE